MNTLSIKDFSKTRYQRFFYLNIGNTNVNKNKTVRCLLISLVHETSLNSFTLNSERLKKRLLNNEINASQTSRLSITFEFFIIENMVLKST